MTEIEYMDDICCYAVFDRICRRGMMMTGEEFLTLYRAGVYDHADMDYWDYVDVWFSIPWVDPRNLKDYESRAEPALMTREEFVNEYYVI